MESLKNTIIVLLLAVCLLGPSAVAKSPRIMLQEGLYAEETEGDLEKAIGLYEQVLKQYQKVEHIAAKAAYQLGMCYLKNGDKTKAAEYFQQIVTEYPKQKTTVSKATKQLKKMSSAEDMVVSGYEIHYRAVDKSADAFKLFNKVCPKAVATHHAKRYRKSGVTIDSICTNDEVGKDKIVAAINNSDELKFIKVVELTEKSKEYVVLADRFPTVILRGNDKSVTKAYIKSVLGKPEDEKEKWLDYRKKYGVDFFVDGYLKEIHINPGFKGRFVNGLTMQSTTRDIFKMFGEPEKIVEIENLRGGREPNVLYRRKDGIGRISYGNIIFWLKGDGINQIVSGMICLKDSATGSYVIHYRAIDQSKNALDLLRSIAPEGVRRHHARWYRGNGVKINTICVDNEDGKDKIVVAINDSDKLKLVKVVEPNDPHAKKADVVPDKLAAENLIAEGWKLWGQRKLSEAEAKFKEAVSKDPASDGAYQGLGWAQLNQGKKLNAKGSFDKCVKLNPKNSAALNGLGWLAHGQGDIDEAISWWEKAVKAQPGATASLSGLTQVYMERKDYAAAAKYYRMWLKAEPNNAQAKEGAEKVKKALGGWHFELKPIIANLDEPGATRYVRACITMLMHAELEQGEGETLIEAKMSILKNKLALYLAGLSVEDASGYDNLKRIQAEILETFNEMLFPDSKPQIKQILFREGFVVQ